MLIAGWKVRTPFAGRRMGAEGEMEHARQPVLQASPSLHLVYVRRGGTNTGLACALQAPSFLASYYYALGKRACAQLAEKCGLPSRVRTTFVSLRLPGHQLCSAVLEEATAT